MIGYSEKNKVYFSVGERTGFAEIKPAFASYEDLEFSFEQYPALIEKGSFRGLAKFNYINLFKNSSIELKQCHAAEHKTYNAFKKKISKLPKRAALKEFALKLPSIKEIEEASSFSVFCGTSFIASTSFSLILVSLPNLFRYKNTDPLFMFSWLAFSIAFLFFSSYLIQRRFLAKPSLIQIFVAQQALKEALNGDN